MAVAWFTGAGGAESGHVRIAFSEDGGRTFGPPRDVDEGHPVGRVDVELLEDTAVVTWVEGSAEQARILARQIGTNWMQSPVTVARTTAARATGFPRMSRSGSELLVAWVDPIDTSSLAIIVPSRNSPVFL